MENTLYAPWRDEYIAGEIKPECVFCDIAKLGMDDENHRLLHIDEFCFIVMNRFPYTPGHFMIIPRFHTDKLEELDAGVWLHMASLVQDGVKLLKIALKAHGVNIGMNLGASAGAGIAEHIHMHLVPRWERDTNFITSIAKTRVYSTDFDRIFEKLRSVSTQKFGWGKGIRTPE